MFKEIALAGLLHDVGKFYQKGKKQFINKIDITGKHPQISKNFIGAYKDLFDKFVDSSVLETLVLKHHEDKSFLEELLCESADENLKPYCYLISTADNLSSSERDEKSSSTENYKVKSLDCVFNRINRDKNTEVFSYLLNSYNNNSLFPKKQIKNDTDRNSIIINKFTEEMDILQNNPPKDFETLMIVLDNLIKKYMWSTPSSTIDDISDVSLYDHLKSTSSLSQALYLYHKEQDNFKKSNIKKNTESKFLLVGINLLNTKEYILKISNYNITDSSKRLRSRAFFVSMLIEKISLDIIKSLNITIQNKIMTISDKSYILIPNTKTHKNKVFEILSNYQKMIFDKFKGEIGLEFEFESMNKDSFKNYSEVLVSLSKKLENKNSQKFKDILVSDEKWNEEKFFIYDDIKTKTVCKICKTRLINQNFECCSECADEIKIGSNLIKSDFVFINSKNNLENFISLFDESDFDYFVKLNGFFEKEHLQKPVILKNTLNYAFVDKDKNVISFDEISKKSKGKDKLAVIKIDIDNLGLLFKEGFKYKDLNLGTMSRTNTMSRMLDLFFTEHINNLLKQKYPFSYSIYCGGDNLILVSAYSNSVNLVLDIYDDFFEFVGQNEKITMSCSVIGFSPKTNISRVVCECEKALNISKQKGNSIYFEGEVFDLKTFKRQMNNNSQIISEAMKTVDINVFRRIQKYSQMYREYLMGDTKKLIFEPFFSRDITRNYNTRQLQKNQPRFLDYVNKIQNNLKNDKYNVDDLYFAKTVIKYCLDTRIN